MKQDSDKKKHIAPADYDRLLLRLKNSDLSVLLQEKIQTAVELEMAALDLTRTEMDLLKLYLYRDLKKLGHFIHEAGEGLAALCHFDMNALEQTFVDNLMAVADQTRIDQEALDEQLDHHEGYYIAGEKVAAGLLQCLNCGSEVQVAANSPVQRCEHCHSLLFKRP